MIYFILLRLHILTSINIWMVLKTPSFGASIPPTTLANHCSNGSESITILYWPHFLAIAPFTGDLCGILSHKGTMAFAFNSFATWLDISSHRSIASASASYEYSHLLRILTESGSTSTPSSRFLRALCHRSRKSSPAVWLCRVRPKRSFSYVLVWPPHRSKLADSCQEGPQWRR